MLCRRSLLTQNFVGRPPRPMRLAGAAQRDVLEWGVLFQRMCPCLPGVQPSFKIAWMRTAWDCSWFLGSPMPLHVVWPAVFGYVAVLQASIPVGLCHLRAFSLLRRRSVGTRRDHLQILSTSLVRVFEPELWCFMFWTSSRSTQSVAASYKPSMLVTRVRLPLCAALHVFPF